MHSMAPDDEPFDLIVDLGEHGGAGGETGRTETVVSKGSGDARVNPMTVGLAAVVLAAVAWLFAGGGGGGAADTRDQASEEEAEASGGTFGQGRPLGIPNFPPSDSHLAADAIALGFRDHIDGDQRFTVVYPVEDGLQMLSAAGPTTPEIDVAFGFEQMARFPLISNGNRTWAVDPADPTASYLVSTQFEVVDTALEGRVAFIDTSQDPIRVGISSFGAWGVGFEVPDASKILPVSGRGLLIMPQTGGTFIVTATGVDPVSEDSAVAASPNGEIYQRCNEALTCELYVANANLPDGLPLDLAVGTDVSISPDGRFVASIGPDGVRVLDTETGATWLTDPAEVQGLAWAPDSSFLAITTTADLILTYTSDRTTADGDAAEVTSANEIWLPLPAVPSSAGLLVVSTAA